MSSKFSKQNLKINVWCYKRADKFIKRIPRIISPLYMLANVYWSNKFVNIFNLSPDGPLAENRDVNLHNNVSKATDLGNKAVVYSH